MAGTDMTIGADTALHRITEAIDAIASTAASHQRSFVVEVMGRHCGYLALMSAIAGGASMVLIPESPPDVDDWEDLMCRAPAQRARRPGAATRIVIVAEGARDRHGNPISAEHVRQALRERLDEDVRVTILGHVQRGGAPSAFDRVDEHARRLRRGRRGAGDRRPSSEPQLIGMRYNRVTRLPLMECVEQTQPGGRARDRGRTTTGRWRCAARGFKRRCARLRTIVRALPHPPRGRAEALPLRRSCTAAGRRPA